MDSQRSLLYVALIFVCFMLWQAWVSDHAPEPSLTSAPTGNAASTAGTPPSGEAALSTDVPEAGQGQMSAPAQSSPSPQTAGEAVTVGQKIHIKTDVLDLEISTRGGDIVSAKLPTYSVSVERPDEPFELFTTEGSPYIAQSGLLHDRVSGVMAKERAPNHYAQYQADQTDYTLAADANELKVPMHWRSRDGVEVTKIFSFQRGSFIVDVDYEIANGSTQAWTGRAYYQLRHGPISKSGSMMTGSYHYTGAAYFADKYHKLPFKKMAEGPLALMVTGGWVAVVQHYFLSAWIPRDQSGENWLYSKVINGVVPEYLIGMRSAALQIAPGTTETMGTRLYVGPKLQKHLEELAPGLELTNDYGIFTVFSKPLFWLLSKIHAVLGNWGWAIIVLTILIKLVFYKLSETSYRSMAKMRKFAPKLQALKERYGDDKQAQQQALMELYRKEKINPLGGCLPILIQIPVFIALYWVLNESVELRQASWLWIKDLSIKDPYFVLPVAMGITMFIQQKLNPPQPDPIMQKMLTAMPIVFTVFFAFFPAGLVLYWFTNNLLSIAQQWMITRAIDQQGS